MSEPVAEKNGPGGPLEPEQELVGFRSNEEWAALLEHADSLVAAFESLPDDADHPHKAQIFELLATIDAIHREALTRLVRLFKQGVLEQVVTDPAIHTLLEMYDLLPRTPACAKVYDFLASEHAPEAAPRPAIPHWVPAPVSVGDVSATEASVCEVDGRDVVFVREGERIFALQSECLCGQGGLSGAAVHGFTLCCPGPTSCLFDIRTGARIGGAGELRCYPLRVTRDGQVLVGFDMPFEPSLPSF